MMAILALRLYWNTRNDCYTYYLYGYTGTQAMMVILAIQLSWKTRNDGYTSYTIYMAKLERVRMAILLIPLYWNTRNDGYWNKFNYGYTSYTGILEYTQCLLY